MSRFLKLTNILINTNSIHYIEKNTSSYTIIISQYKTLGFMIVGSGVFDAKCIELDFCQKNNTNDYNIITEYINTLK